MKIHLGQQAGNHTDYFYNYFSLGVDLEGSKIWVLEWNLREICIFYPNYSFFEGEERALEASYIKAYKLKAIIYTFYSFICKSYEDTFPGPERSEARFKQLFFE